MSVSVMFKCGCGRSFMRHYGDPSQAQEVDDCPECGLAAASVPLVSAEPADLPVMQTVEDEDEKPAPQWRRRRQRQGE